MTVSSQVPKANQWNVQILLAGGILICYKYTSYVGKWGNTRVECYEGCYNVVYAMSGMVTVWCMVYVWYNPDSQKKNMLFAIQATVGRHAESFLMRCVPIGTCGCVMKQVSGKCTPWNRHSGKPQSLALFLPTKGVNVEMKEPHIPCVTQSCSQMPSVMRIELLRVIICIMCP